MNKNYTVSQLAKLAGVSVRTLHVYDKLKLLKPAIRTDTGYRLYNDKDLLRLQQILFYKELDFTLKDIRAILDEPGFDVIKSLEGHKKALSLKKRQLNIMMDTIDRTINNLKNNMMLKPEDLYDGIPREDALAYRAEAIERYGNEVVEHSEKHLLKLNKEELKTLVNKQKDLAARLFEVKHLDAADQTVQTLIHLHYLNTRKLWGTQNASNTQKETYKGLGQLYVTDERFVLIKGEYDGNFAKFISTAMSYYADKML